MKKDKYIPPDKMNVVEKFNALKGIYTKEELKALAHEAWERINDFPEAGQVWIRIERILMNYRFEKELNIVNENPIVIYSKLGIPMLPDGEEISLMGTLGKVIAGNDLYQLVTDKLVAEIKKGVMPWRRPWEIQEEGSGVMAMNFATKKPYKGVNSFLLNFYLPASMKEPYKSPFFMTAKQIEEKGGALKKGAKSVQVIFYTPLFFDGKEKIKPEVFEAKLNECKENPEKLKECDELGYVPVIRGYEVFNADWIEGIEFPEIKPREIKGYEFEPIESAEAIVEYMPNRPPIQHKEPRAYYSHSDFINMPQKKLFKNSAEYYSTLFHELIHATESPSRLNRQKGERFGDKKYAYEELVAELGAAFLCAESGVLYHTMKNSATYLKGWQSKLLAAMETNNKFIFQASGSAQKAADYILDRDKDGVPRYLNELYKQAVKEAKEKAEKPKATPKPKPKPKPEPTPEPTPTPKKKGTSAKVKNKGFNINRKISISDASAINDVLTLKKYEGIGKMEAGMIYRMFKDDASKIILEEDLKDMQRAILPKSRLVFNDGGLDLELNQLGKDFIEAVKGRKSTLIAKRNGTDLFPQLAGAKKKRGRPRKAALAGPIDDFVEGAERLATTIKKAVEIPVQFASIVKPMNELGKSHSGENFEIQDKAISDFLGTIERKPVGSVVMTLDAPQGSGKTRTLFRLINALAESGYSVLFASLEEHPESNLFTDKRDQYLSKKAMQNISATGELPNGAKDLMAIAPNYDVIVIDSWGKIPNKPKLDEIRRALNGKLIIAIYQRTVTGSMRGGSDAQFDGDLIAKMHKGDLFDENYVYWDKNRYTKNQSLVYFPSTNLTANMDE